MYRRIPWSPLFAYSMCSCVYPCPSSGPSESNHPVPYVCYFLLLPIRQLRQCLVAFPRSANDPSPGQCGNNCPQRGLIRGSNVMEPSHSLCSIDFPQQHEVRFLRNPPQAADPPRNATAFPAPRPQLAFSSDCDRRPLPGQPHDHASVLQDAVVSNFHCYIPSFMSTTAAMFC